jgi:hypothetical protein
MRTLALRYSAASLVLLGCEPALNAVIFDQTDVPANGDVVDISYAY